MFILSFYTLRMRLIKHVQRKMQMKPSTFDQVDGVTAP